MVPPVSCLAPQRDSFERDSSVPAGVLIPAARRVAAKLAWVAIACWLAAAVMSLLVVASFGGRPVDLHVRWADTTTDAERVSLERRFHLVDPERREGQTYSYTLIDVSRANIEAL